MKFNDKNSVYSQIATNIKMKIYNGEVKLGEPLDSVRKLATTYQVTIKTIQNTIISLEEEGIVMKKAGVGTFVTHDEKAVKKSKELFIDGLLSDFFRGMKSIGIDKEEAKSLIIGGKQ